VKLKEEANTNRSQGQKYLMIAGSLATILAGSAAFICTRNPEAL
jgi:hypothetical protein